MATEVRRSSAPPVDSRATHAADPSAAGDPSRASAPLGARAAVALLLGSYVALVVTLAAFGHELVHATAFAGVRGLDGDLNRWMAEHRTATLDTVTAFWTT